MMAFSAYVQPIRMLEDENGFFEISVFLLAPRRPSGGLLATKCVREFKIFSRMMALFCKRIANKNTRRHM